MVITIETKIPTFCVKNHSVGCIAHTLNLAAHNGLNALGISNSQPDQPSTIHDPNPILISNILDLPDGVSLQYDSIISRIAQLASYLHQSPQRREKFIAMVNLIYDDKTSTNATTLLSHVCTRWNLTYDLLKQALSLCEAYNQFCSPDNFQQYWLSPLEWDKVKVMVAFLQPLYEATVIVCASSYPTINQALPLYLLLIKKIFQVCFLLIKQFQQHSKTTNFWCIGSPVSNTMCSKLSLLHMQLSILSKYIQILLLKPPAICASILDPQFKIKFFTSHKSTLAQFVLSSHKLREIFEDVAKKNSQTQPTIPPYSTNLKEKTSGLFDEMYPSVSNEGCSLENELH
ncbi:hypothetical protein O181_033975 [Austropuccinia psidii MF-1]|uniref:hAT-like transposase RNase-H fold domain-containing protein n=1 Tax=Austropuccinia psidii MF-1 TaxID=1389203 RepID=A0A9Q3H9R0_9BASI|nr:hypothetical protein [Austropuccinia psidii MF-1]